MLTECYALVCAYAYLNHEGYAQSLVKINKLINENKTKNKK